MGKLDEILGLASRAGLSESAASELYLNALDIFDIAHPEQRCWEKKAKIVSFDGNGGSGKDTQIRILEHYLQNIDQKYIISNQKRRNQFRPALKLYWSQQNVSEDDPKIVSLIFAIGAMYFVDFELSDLMTTPENLIILNRSYISSIGSQGAQGLDPAQIKDLYTFYPEIDLPILLVCSAEEALNRVKTRAEIGEKPLSRFEDETYLTRTCEVFPKLDALIPNSLLIDSTEMDKEIVSKKVIQAVKEVLNS